MWGLRKCSVASARHTRWSARHTRSCVHMSCRDQFDVLTSHGVGGDGAEARFRMQQSWRNKHKHLKMGTRSSVQNKNNNEKNVNVLRWRPRSALSGLSALKEFQTGTGFDRGSEVGWGRDGGAVGQPVRWAVCQTLWSCVQRACGFSHDICARTSMGGFHCFLRAEGRALEELSGARIGLKDFPLLPLSPIQPEPIHTEICGRGPHSVHSSHSRIN